MKMCRGSEFHEMLTMFAVSYMYPVQNSRARGHPHPVLAAELAARLTGQLDTLCCIILTYTNALGRRIDGSPREVRGSSIQVSRYRPCRKKDYSVQIVFIII